MKAMLTFFVIMGTFSCSSYSKLNNTRELASQDENILSNDYVSINFKCISAVFEDLRREGIAKTNSDVSLTSFHYGRGSENYRSASYNFEIDNKKVHVSVGPRCGNIQSARMH